MSLSYIPDSISFILLAWIFILLWKEHKRFRSLLPIAVAIVLLSIGRIADIALEFSMLDWKRRSIDLLLGNIGNVSDAVGAFFLVYGFLRTVEYQRRDRKRIEDLETLLPLCAWCKRYRTESGEWKPIEAYLLESGAPEITHGICPECAAKQRKAALS
jgi:hypothetical protein